MAKKKTPVPKDVMKLIDEEIKDKKKSDTVKPDLDSDTEDIKTNDISSEDSIDVEDEMTEGINEDLSTGAAFVPGETVNISITDELKKDFIDYAMSVIVERALPDVTDGLKPSQRRVLVAMKDLTLWPTGATRKCAKVVGETMGNYHPHGDQSIYQTMVNLAQPFTTRYPLVHGQGNFGSIDGDSAASMRYTEAKLEKISVELLKDLDKGTVPFRVTYDGARFEPVALPAAYPNLLVNGSTGIAVGMATKIPPHNLKEVINAVLLMIDKKNSWKGISAYNTLRTLNESENKIPQVHNNQPQEYWENYVPKNDEKYKEKVALLKEFVATGKVPVNAKELGFDVKTLETLVKDYNEEEGFSLYPKFQSSATLDELLEHIKGPDFPTGGHIYNMKDIRKFYETGNGRIKMRGIMTVEENKKGRFSIIVSAIPYQLNKAVLVEQIAHLVRDKKIEGIRDLRDESANEEIRIYIELKSGHSPQVIMQKLYKYTPLQMNFNANMIALVNDEPRTLNLKRALELYIEHRMKVYIRKLEFEMAKNKYDAHILEGLLKALDFIEEVIKTIRASQNKEDARINLIDRFELTIVQAQAILDMPLSKLAALERQNIQDNYDGLLANIKHHEEYLAEETKILELVKNDLIEVRDKYGDARRTKVYKGDVNDPQEEDLVKNEPALITISKTGYVKRISPDEYRLQHRGGKGSIGAKLKENDYIEHALLCNTHDHILAFMSDGKVFDLRAYEVPEASRTAKGLPVVNLLQITPNTQIRSILSLESREDAKYIAMATTGGTIKKTKLSEYDNIRKNGLVAISLREGDSLVQVQLTNGKDEFILVTESGKSIRFPEDEVKDSGRSTIGVKGINLKNGDKVIAFDIVNSNDDILFTVSERGFGKGTKFSEFKQQHRGGSGIYAARTGKKTGTLVVAQSFPADAKKENTEIIIISKQGQVIKTPFKSVPILGNRQTYGVKLFRLSEEDVVVGLAS